MPPFCIDCGIFHARGECEEIRRLRATAPRITDHPELPLSAGELLAEHTGNAAFLEGEDNE